MSIVCKVKPDEYSGVSSRWCAVAELDSGGGAALGFLVPG